MTRILSLVNSQKARIQKENQSVVIKSKRLVMFWLTEELLGIR